MKNRLWIGLLVALLLSMQGFLLRTGNEAQNKTVITAAEYQLFEKNAPAVWNKASQTIGERYISPNNLVVVSLHPDTSEFLRERLGHRLSAGELLSFQAAGKDYFIINAELEQLDKSKTAVRELDTLLGFEETILEKLQAKGFSIILRPGGTSGSNTSYFKKYEPLIRQYNVQALNR